MKDIKKLLPLITITSCLIAYFLDKRVCFGIALGSISSWFYLFILSKTIDGAIVGKSDFASSTIAMIIRISLMVIPLLLGVIFPEKIHILGVFIGFLLFKFALLINAFSNCKKSKNGVK